MLEFDDLNLIEETVRIGKDQYLLREADEGAVCKWRNSQMRTAILGPDGKPKTIGDIADSAPLLISLCLFKIDGERQLPVTLDTVRKWPNRVTKVLHERIMEISDLNTEDTEEAILKRITADSNRLKELREQKQTEKNG